MARCDGASGPRLAVVADDLTGAADACAPFADRGLRVAIALSGELPDDVDVLAVVTDSRWRPAAEATDRVRAAVASLAARRPERLFVKIDSTLRGRVHDDVAAALAEWRTREAVATPAFPAQGRVVRDGTLLVRGTPLVARIAERFPPGVQVVDAVSHEDLLAVARRVGTAGSVGVGSGGLARALAEVLVPQPGPHRHRPAPARGVLVVVGTGHAVSRAQASALAAEGAVPVVLGGGDPCPAETAVAALRVRRRVLLTYRAEGEIEPDSPQAVAVAGDMAATVRDILAAVPVAGLVVTGGATALAVAEALRAGELRLCGEVAEGLPLGELASGNRAIPVVTKSGGFGDEGFLVRAAEALEAAA